MMPFGMITMFGPVLSRSRINQDHLAGSPTWIAYELAMPALQEENAALRSQQLSGAALGHPSQAASAPTPAQPSDATWIAFEELSPSKAPPAAGSSPFQQVCLGSPRADADPPPTPRCPPSHPWDPHFKDEYCRGDAGGWHQILRGS